jgi:hypothetical protein
LRAGRPARYQRYDWRWRAAEDFYLQTTRLDTRARLLVRGD